LKATTTCPSGTLPRSTTNQMLDVKLNNECPTSSALPKLQGGRREIPTSTYCGRKQNYRNKREVVANFWFHWDNIE